MKGSSTPAAPPKPFAVGAEKNADPKADEQRREDAELARARARAEKRRLQADKVAQLFEDAWYETGMTWSWFVRPKGGAELRMTATLYFDKEKNRHLPEITHSFVVDKFTDCDTDEACEERHHTALRRRLLNAHGIKHVVLHRGKSLADVLPDLEAQRL